MEMKRNLYFPTPLCLNNTASGSRTGDSLNEPTPIESADTAALQLGAELEPLKLDI